MFWRHRWLLWSFTRREIADRYTGSLVGAAWALAHPLALLGVYAFVFTAVFRVKLPAAVTDAGYIAFVAVTLWPWLMVSDSLSRGTGAVQANAALVRKVAFPHRLVVYASVLATFAVHLAGYVFVLVVLRALGEPIALSGIPAALAIVGVLLIACTGITLMLAAMQVLVRDVSQVLGVLMMLLFYATPVLYPMALVPEEVRPWLAANPLTMVVERLREILLANSGLRAADILLLLGACVIFALGTWMFERLSPFFEDFL